MPKGRRHFRRVPGRRSYRSLFVLAVEGTRTEPQYFSIFNVKRSVHVKVLTQPGGTDPFHVLKRMERYLSQERLKASDQAWLVVDKDHWTDEQLTKLHSWAQKHQSYGFVLSNPNFEYWLLLHFEEGNGISSSQDCADRIKQHLPHYKKTIDTSKISFEQIGNAIQRAKRHDTPPCEDWPRKSGGTTVYRLVESILEVPASG